MRFFLEDPIMSLKPGSVMNVVAFTLKGLRAISRAIFLADFSSDYIGGREYLSRIRWDDWKVKR